jgi:hypothetical protein
VKLFLVGRNDIANPNIMLERANDGEGALHKAFGSFLVNAGSFEGWYVEVTPLELTK